MTEQMAKSENDLKLQLNIQSENIVQLFNHVMSLNQKVYGGNNNTSMSQMNINNVSPNFSQEDKSLNFSQL